MKRLTFLVLISLCSFHLYAQESNDSSRFDVTKALEFILGSRQDSTFIRNLTDEISIRLLASTKYNFFKLRDRQAGSNLVYRPDNRLNFGVGVTYKIFSIDLAFNVGLTQNNKEQDQFRNSKYFDFVGSVFTSRHFVELSYRYYFGHYMGRSRGLSVPIESLQRDRNDLRSTFFSIDYLNALNFEKFSFKAPFVHNEIQLRSAGSIVVGVSFNTSTIDADSSMIPPEVRLDFDPTINLSSIYLASASVNAGYMYSFVRKSWYVTFSAIPGLALTVGDYSRQSRIPFDLQPSLKLRSMNAIGYNGRRFYTGLHLVFDIQNAGFGDGRGVELVRSKGKIFFGYRLKRKGDR